MYLPILYPSAVRFWLHSCNNEFLETKMKNGWKYVQLPSNYEIHTESELCCWISKNYGIPLPLDVLALSFNLRLNNQYCRGRLLDPELVREGLVFITRICSDHEKNKTRDDDILCVASPELCFLQAARYLPMLEVIKLGYDLCAIYSFDETQEYRQVAREPAAEVEQIKMYLSHYPGKRGIKKAQRALTYVLNRSNSPMETRLAMIAVLPFYLGGYALIRPELNKTVLLSKEAARAIGRAYLTCDMVWEKEKVIVEYDSNLTHLDVIQHARDKARISALSESGYKIICLTADSIRPQNIDATFSSIRKALGMKKRTNEIMHFKEKRRVVIPQILYCLK